MADAPGGTDTPTAADGDELADTPHRVEIVERAVAFEGMVWDVVRESFAYNGERITREFVDHTGAVSVLAMDDDERVLLIRQYRHPVRSREWEIPAGLLDEEGEPALEAARRELAEEADLAAEQWHVLAEFLNSPGGSNESIRIYLARGLSAVPAFERTAEEADIEVRWVTLDEALAAVLARRIQNPSTVIAVLTAAVLRGRDWHGLGSADEPWRRHPTLGDW
ncbi:MAG: ADP-ribose pyrophosphatase [Naasia sp.]|nr:ADP-ribose pyrophosphatase [Naasia sp.]